jgi:hypothetical protein
VVTPKNTSAFDHICTFFLGSLHLPKRKPFCELFREKVRAKKENNIFSYFTRVLMKFFKLYTIVATPKNTSAFDHIPICSVVFVA